MRRSSELVVAALLVGVPAAGSAPARPNTAPALARLGFAERRVELSSGQGWHEAKEGTALRLGDGLRTAADALARLELPWMAMTVSAASFVRFPDDYLLSTVVEQGRVQLRTERSEILKVVTGEAEVRGHGSAVVRREGRVTLVAALAGRFLVEGAGQTVVLLPGAGTVVHEGKPPLTPVALPETPEGLSPGADPRYAARGEAVSLSWTSKAGAHQVEVLPVGSDEVLIQQDVGRPPWRLTIPWPGAFRWRVAARDARGLEGKPSADGLICVDK